MNTLITIGIIIFGIVSLSTIALIASLMENKK